MANDTLGELESVMLVHRDADDVRPAGEVAAQAVAQAAKRSG